MDADTVYDELTEFVKKLDELKETLIDDEMLLVDQIEVSVRIAHTAALDAGCYYPGLEFEDCGLVFGLGLEYP